MVSEEAIRAVVDGILRPALEREQARPREFSGRERSVAYAKSIHQNLAVARAVTDVPQAIVQMSERPKELTDIEKEKLRRAREKRERRHNRGW